MRSRKSFFKKLILSGATAVSVIGFASPAVFAWDGGNFSNDGNNFNNHFSSRCDGDWDWDDSDCMRFNNDNFRFSDFNFNNHCDHRFSNNIW